ncbi:MAG: Mrp/NBP35 family ATP-binding protein [Anaerolinea sp.]|nr:Mrp/NBP35 family ATP-binding protein [Anaerolinea sp.]MCC6974070.1 Mrp/NBP35 family ATP-binding protein [Anaerolineae bacterium]CAG0952248.1 Iron-sulfur cluster carrier protein [Anaerolineae bacterium]
MSDELRDAAMKALSTVIEPELHKDIVTLGMVRDLEIVDSVAKFTIMLTTPACPLKDVMYKAAEVALKKVPGITGLNVKWDAEVPKDRRVHGRLNMPLRNIIAVGSGKGGVGKTSVSVNIAISLAQEGAKVGLMDADILTPNVPIMLGLTSGRPTVKDGKIQPFEVYGIKAISMGFMIDPDKAMVWRGPMLNSAIRQFFNDVDWGDDIDYMIVDLPPGTGDAPLSLAQAVPLTGAVIVSQPQEVAIGDALRSISMFEQLNVPILGIVENMAGELFGEGGGERLSKQRSTPFLGRVPLDVEIRRGGDLGRPVVMAHPDSDSAKAFRQIARDLAARISVLQMMNADVIPINIID